METDINKIKLLSKKRETENVEFRSFLKFVDDPDEIDEIVHGLYKEISSKIDCTACANCCKIAGPILNNNDIENLSKHCSLEINDFIDNYLDKDEDGEYFFDQMPCRFLENNLCTCYSERPEDCRSYPHLHKDEIISRLYGVITNCSICPIVYNVYERLKEIVWK